jgi:hypothetical protein
MTTRTADAEGYVTEDKLAYYLARARGGVGLIMIEIESNEQTKRNRKRFHADFIFQLTPRENKSLKSQFETSNIGRGGRRSLPYAFTEHGAIMAATVLNSEQAVEMSVFVVRAFVRLREMLAANKDLAARIEELEEHLETHDGAIHEIFHVIKKLMNLPSRRRSKIGFALPPARTG